MSPILYTIVGVTDLDRAARFYDAVFAVIGWSRSAESSATTTGWGPAYDDGASFWIRRPFDGAPATAGNGTMFALRGRSDGDVIAFHAAALAHGGRSEGEPGIRERYGPDFFVAYVRDPDGNKLACAFHHHVPDALGP